MNQSFADRLKRVSTFVFDIDGVFTDATLTVTKDDVSRTFNVRDGYAVQMAVKSGYNVAVISGGKQESIVARMNSIGVKDVFIKVGTADKPKFLEDYLKSKGIAAEEVLFIGDDIPDLLLMRAFPVVSCCPADAVEEVKSEADYVTALAGGKGAVREVIELVMKAQDKWMKVF
jgi:3-deoxy-D-manno-octulosonate 8-phosphate phosphatase (KDO 8-P phosphatase)